VLWKPSKPGEPAWPSPVGIAASGRPWRREREGRPFSTCALAFSESWTDVRT